MDKENKTRKDRRKERRLNKQNKKFTSWLGHQRGKTVKPKEKKVEFLSSKTNFKGMPIKKKAMGNISSVENHVSANKRKRGLEKRAKSKFHEYLKMELGEGVPGAEEDLMMERRLAKKLLKGRNLGGPDDGLNLLIEGTPSFDDFSNAKHDIDDYGSKVNSQKRKHKHSSSEDEGKNHKCRKSSKAHTNGSEECYPTNKTTDTGEKHDALSIEGPSNETMNSVASTKYTSPPSRPITTRESEEHEFGLKVKRLLSKLVGSTVESTSEEVAKIFQSVTRSVGCEIVGEKIMAFCVWEEKGGEQSASVFAAFVAGMACLVGVDFSAKILAYVARSFEDEYCKGNKLSLGNLTSLFCHLYIFGVCDSYIVFDLLDTLSKRLTELDVPTILKILEWCGMKLRGDDPVSMKEFVVAVQSRVNAIKIDTKLSRGRKPENTVEMESMLEIVCDIKDNKKRSKEDPAYHARIKKWLQKLRSEDVLLRNLTWSKLLDPEKKGQWWFSGEINSITDNFEEVATTIIDKEAQEVQKLLQLAATQGMNTGTRRAIFLIIMSAEDYLDAFEKILRLNLSGKQDREVMRVIIYCCMQERNFNKYYTFLASKFCGYNKNYKFTLQYCLWDHWKEIDSMESERSLKLASFVAEMLRISSLSLAVLKSVNLMDPSQLTPSRITHFRNLFETLFEKNADDALWNMFTRVAGSPDLESLRSSLVFFIKQYVVIDNSDNPLMAQKLGVAKKALHNVAGVLK